MRYKHKVNQSGFTLIEIIAIAVIVAIFGALMLTMLSDSFVKSSDPLKRLLKSTDLSKVMMNIMADYSPYPRWKKSTNYSAVSPPNKVLPTGMNGRFYICKATSGDSKSGSSEPQWRDSGDTQDGNVIWKADIWVKQTAYAVGDLVIPPNPNGHFYRCVTAGTSGLNEPTWPITGYAAISDGTAQWKRLLGYIYEEVFKPDTPSTPNLNNKKNSSYGQYYVAESRFVKFVSLSIQPITSGDPENILEIKLKNNEGETLTALFTAKEN
jgi:hypothetical protein